MPWIDLVAGALDIAFGLFGGYSSDKASDRAAELEKQGKYREACYQYGLALANGAMMLQASDAKSHIKSLWKNHGPFEFSDILETIKKNDDPNHPGEAWHHRTVQYIQDTIKE